MASQRGELVQQIAKVLQRASGTVKNHNWFTTYESDYLSRLSIPYLSVQTQYGGFPWFSLLVTRLLQSAVYIYSLISKFICQCSDSAMHFLSCTGFWISNLSCFPSLSVQGSGSELMFPLWFKFSCCYKCSRSWYLSILCIIVKAKKKKKEK